MGEAGHPARALSVALLVGAGTAAALVLVLVLLLGGGAPRAAAPGLTSAGPLPDWTLAVLPLTINLVAASAVGMALLAGRFLHRGGQTPEAIGATRALAAGWAALSLLLAVVAALRFRGLTAQSPGESPGESPSHSALWGAPRAALWAVTGSAQVQAALAASVLAAAAALVARTRPRLALPLVLLALLPEVLTGHVRTADATELAAGMLLVHVVAASLWVGGLVGLTWMALQGPGSWQDMLPGFSRMAFGCVVVLAVSGSVVALTAGGAVADLLGSPYGAVVLLKALLLLGLAVIGLFQRRYVLARGGRGRRDFLLLAGSELILMTLAFALATGLAQTPTPS